MRVGIYRFVIFVSRVLRWLTWGGAAAFAGSEYDRFQHGMRTIESAVQEAAFASSVLVGLVVVYIIARASDRIWALVAEDLTGRLPAAGT